MLDHLQLREAQWHDLPDMMVLFRESILHVNASYYTREQLEVWASAADHADRWAKKMEEQYVLVATLDDHVVGFGSLRQDYIDLLYVHKDHQGQGIAGRIYEVLESRARYLGMQALATDASTSAKPFFEGKGFVFVATRNYLLQDVAISNNRMIKSLH